MTAPETFVAGLAALVLIVAVLQASWRWRENRRVRREEDAFWRHLQDSVDRARAESDRAAAGERHA